MPCAIRSSRSAAVTNGVRGAAFLTGTGDSLVAGGRRDVHRRGRAGQRVPAGILARSRDRRHPHQLPDARSGHHRPRWRHQWSRPGNPAIEIGRAAPATCCGRGARLRRVHPRSPTGQVGQAGPASVTARTSRHREMLGAALARRGRPSPAMIDRMKTSQEDCVLVTVGRRQHPDPGLDTWRQRGRSSPATNTADASTGAAITSRRPGGPDLPRGTGRRAGRAR